MTGDIGYYPDVDDLGYVLDDEPIDWGEEADRDEEEGITNEY